MKKLILNNLSDTKKIAKILANELSLHSEIYLLLNGDLGSGKTTLTKFILEKLKIIDNISSPTFVISNQYNNKKFTINHIDFYRINQTEDFNLFLEMFENSINIIEWPNIIKKFLTSKLIIELKIELKNDTKRNVELQLNFEPKSKKLSKLASDK